MVNRLGLNEPSSVIIILQENFLLSIPSFVVVTPLLECSAYRFFFLRLIIGRNLKLRTHLSPVPLQRMRESKFKSTIIAYDI